MDLKLAYGYCRDIAKNHYENFPVASFIIPKQYRNPIAAIYAFARTADDFADEGCVPNETRLLNLELFDQKLSQIANGNQPTELLFHALFDTIHQYKLPIELFRDLIKAFKQDVTKNRYNNINELFEYCKLSANPIGRLLLILTGKANLNNLILSDSICTGLQLLNFWQDIESDLKIRNRCYLPNDKLLNYNISINDLMDSDITPEFNKMVVELVVESLKLFRRGKPLGEHLSGLFGLEIRTIINCGLFLGHKLTIRENAFKRPTLHKFDFLKILIKSIFS